jgi:hypothetical protein
MSAQIHEGSLRPSSARPQWAVLHYGAIWGVAKFGTAEFAENSSSARRKNFCTGLCCGRWVNVSDLGVASSADGTKLMALTGVIYSSFDSGMIWAQSTAPGSGWASIVSSANGARWVVVSGNNGSGIGGLMYCSTNSGTTWTQTSAPVTNWTAVASSADGSKLVASAYGGRIYTSNLSPPTFSPALNITPSDAHARIS